LVFLIGSQDSIQAAIVALPLLARDTLRLDMQFILTGFDGSAAASKIPGGGGDGAIGIVRINRGELGGQVLVDRDSSEYYGSA